MFVMRPAVTDDREPMVDLIVERARWMRDRGLRGADGWQHHAETLALQAGDPGWPVWVLVTEDGHLIGRTTAGLETPQWCFTDAERAEPAIFLSTTVIHPRFAGQRLGCLIVSWALDYAARCGMRWVRRGTGPDPGLVSYYRDVQGFTVVRYVERHGVTACALARRAEFRPELAGVLRVPAGAS